MHRLLPLSLLGIMAISMATAAEPNDKGLAPPPTNLPKLQYIDAPAPIPFYPPSDKWGTQSEPLKTMQAPLSPADSLKHLRLPEGFHAELFAAEPDIVKVIAMAWDARGRLWVAETLDYPNDMQPAGKGRDRIKICQDTDHDGKADKFTIFADKLSIPTSLCFANGGVIVTQAPDTLFLKDTNGDDQADVRKTLFTGWGTRDTHAGPSNLRYGFDNWIWCTVGYSGFDGTVGGKPMRFGQGIVRFKADGSALEFVSSTSNNTWGLGFSETGEVFASTANNDHSVFLSIPNRYYESVRGWHGAGSHGIADSEVYHPITEHHRQMDWHGRFTAAAGHALYTARAFPAKYWNRIAFVTEGTGHLIHQNLIEPSGSGFITRDSYNFAASTDEWTAPVVADVGPDGAVWVSDWYSYIFQHNPTPHGFETGKGNAYITPLRDKKHGRVYRIVYDDDTKPAQTTSLDSASSDQLIAALSDDNLFWRLTAQRLLVERGDKSIEPKLLALLDDTKLDAIGNAPGAIHALWTLAGLGENNAALHGWMHPAASVRKTALDVASGSDPSTTDILLNCDLLADPDSRLRLSALLALSRLAPSERAGSALIEMMRRPENAGDRWIPDAATAAAARNAGSFLSAVLASARDKAQTRPAAQTANLVPNGSFETIADGLPLAWELHNWQGVAEAVVDTTDAPAGKNCLRLTAKDDADSSVSVVLDVQPHTNYRLSARIRTKGVRAGTGRGALVNVHELQTPVRVATEAITGTTEWTTVQASFNSADLKRITINCLLGGWGKSKGVAWFDDVRLEKSGQVVGVLETMLRVVTTHYAQGAPLDTVVPLLSSLQGVDDATARALLDGLLAGWPARGATLPESDDIDRALRAVSDSLSADNRTRFAALAQRMGRGKAFANEALAAQKQLLASIDDAALDRAARLDSARRLIELNDTAANVDAILARITPQCAPSLASGLASSLASSRLDTTGPALLKRFKLLPPTARKAAIDVMLRRASWHLALLDSLESARLSRSDLSTEQLQLLTAVSSDPATILRAKKIANSTGRAADPDRQKMIDRLLPLADAKGDVKLGKSIFEKNCLVCHTFAGNGGKVGPDLTGIGKNPRREILLNIIDPNRSVEGNFQLWIIQTKDGQTITGRLDNESQATVQLLDAAGKQQIVQRKDIKRMASSGVSVMPEGFEQLPAKELTDLLQFLAQPIATPN